jgi:hypothetical protein
MERIKYTRTEFISPTEKKENVLSHFVYDVPYLASCGVLPPLHILNKIFLSGGGDGGMSPGAIWKPFSIDEIEYADLVEKVLNPNTEELRNNARYSQAVMKIDKEFDYIQDKITWGRAVCEKHRESYFKEQE